MEEIKRYLLLADLALGVPDYLETPLSFQEWKAIRDLIQRAEQRGQDLLPILRRFAASISAVKELMPLVELAAKDVSWQRAGVIPTTMLCGSCCATCAKASASRLTTAFVSCRTMALATALTLVQKAGLNILLWSFA